MINKEAIWIETGEFKDRTEFRVGFRKKYPKGFRTGMYEDYLGHWEYNGNACGKVDYVFIAYKKNNWLKRLFGNDYNNQKRIAIQKCEKLIEKEKETAEIPKIQRYEK